MQLLELSRITESAVPFLTRAGKIFATFDQRTQDSGNVSFGVQAEYGRFFVKTAGSPGAPGSLPHGERVRWLRNAVRLSGAVQDPALCRLRNVIESKEGPLLVYDWAPGELLRVSKERRADPTCAYGRFRALPLPELSAALSAIFRAHLGLCASGWVASDFYDGALIYDFEACQVTLVDLDMYRDGPFFNETGRMLGSTRFMAPEELERGARIDELTTVFTMGRCITVFLAGRDDVHGSDALRGLLRVAEKACRAERSARFASFREFFDAWLQALAAGLSK